MKIHEATERAYNNGYEKGHKEGYIAGFTEGQKHPLMHGHWIQQGEPDEDGNGQYRCSVCSAGEKHNPIVDVPYCWKCGAKMDGDG